ncbi:thioredoxin family protein [Flagellimonas meridianipacifica]|uniref:Thioredoxin-like protein n=1 Tax=Flagellimonas meridianipacifica TaxID=1080225 RepID=A0A2T0M936_9FLAO|nr:thioredoxin family protein [Allomuricauda pacifica]PRX54021.1 thioredoxin-like protein [Allomuricauda pacifica]
MKKGIFLICLLLGLAAKAQVWEDSYTNALNKANTEDKPIVLVFSGSDWCGPCIRFKKKILDSEEFVGFATNNYVLYNADFPRKKKNSLSQEKLNDNKGLAEKYNPKGYFPLVVVLDKNESILGKTGFDKRKSPEKYLDLFNGYLK